MFDYMIPQYLTPVTHLGHLCPLAQKRAFCNPVRIHELVQNLTRRYVKLSSLQKRQIVESVFSNLRLDDVIPYGDYRLPFVILAENTHHPLNYSWVDDYRTAVFTNPVALDLSIVA